MIGMSRITGRRISDSAPVYTHLHQSIHDILTTLIGTRLCRRDYGSLIPHLIDQPSNQATQLRLMSAAVTAIIRWEPRVKINRAVVSQLAEQPGRWTLTTTGTVINANGMATAFNDQFALGIAA